MFSSLKSITKKKRRNYKEKNRYYINKISQHTETLTYSQTVTLKQKLKVTVSFYKKKKNKNERNNTTKVYIFAFILCSFHLYGFNDELEIYI